MGKNFTEEQKQAIYITDKNLVVGAGAGSGKTTVLSARFVNLVESGKAAVDEILTLTFTDKAAGEMRDKIRAELNKSGDSGVRKQLGDFDKASISTIDSFCKKIVLNGCQQLEIPPEFSADMEAVEKLARDEALKFLNKNIKNEILSDLVADSGFSQVWDDLAALAREKVLLKPDFSFAADFERLLDFMKKFCLQALQKIEEAAYCMVQQIDAMDFGDKKRFKPAEKELYSKLHETAQSEILDAAKPFKVLFEERAFYKIINILKKFGQFDIRGRTEDKVAVKEQLSILHHYSGKKFGSSSKYKYLNEQDISMLDYLSLFAAKESLSGFFGLLDKFAEGIIRFKKDTGILSFSDISSSAVWLLENDREIRDFYKQKFKYIMVDEFQDNNQLQKNLTFLLAERADLHCDGIPDAESLEQGKLFFVGDEKQSIYLFRGADVSVFKNLSSELEASGGCRITLPDNFRSEPELIALFNDYFPYIMSSIENSEGSVFEASFEPLRSRSANFELPVKSFFYLNRSQKNIESLSEDYDDIYNEALKVVEIIQNGVTHEPLKIPERDSDGKVVLRNAEYGDFAVLLRTLSEQYKFEKLFDSAGIPYSTDAVTSLFFGTTASEFSAYLETLLYPFESTPFAALLRSPFCGLDNQQFDSVLQKFDSAADLVKKWLKQNPDKPEVLQAAGFLKTSVVEEIAAGAADGVGDVLQPMFDFTEDEASEAEHFLSYENRIAELVIRGLNVLSQGQAVKLVKHFWLNEGYKFFTVKKRNYRQAFKDYQSLLFLAEKYDRENRSAAELLDFINTNINSYSKLDDLGSGTTPAGCVRIMTIHKSKGLEFPVCIVAATGKKGGAGNHPVLNYERNSFPSIKFRSPFDKSLKIKPVRKFFSGIKKQEEIAEMKRLLYVAFTRAESYLYVTGSVGQHKEPSGDSLLGLFYDYITSDERDNPLFEFEWIEPAGLKDVFASASSFSVSGSSSGTERVDRLQQLYSSQSPVVEKFGRREYSAVELNSLCYELSLVRSQALLPFAPFRQKDILSSKFDDYLTKYNVSTAFGTVVHGIIENYITHGIEDIQEAHKSLIPYEFPELFEKNAKRCAQLFFSSDIYNEVKSAVEVASEFPFLYKLNLDKICLFVSGSIDLYYRHGNKNVIIDFKTDKTPDNRYSVQLALYRDAVTALTGLETESYLFFLRTGDFVEVKEEIPLGILQQNL